MRHVTVLMVCAVLAGGLLAAGCGGGGTEPNGSTGSVLEGTVYSSSVSTSAVEGDKAAQGDPVPDCEVTVERVRDRQELGGGRTNAEGRYRFEGLPTGDEVLVRARLQSGERLQTRVRLRSATCQGDVSEDTTLASTAQGMVDPPGQAATGDDVEVGRTVAQACLRHQQQHRYRYGALNGQRPDFADAGQVQNASRELLRAATGDAVERARQTADGADCTRATDLVAGQLRAEGHLDAAWTQYVRERVAWALTQRRHWTPEQVAAVMRRVGAQGANAADVEGLRTRIRQMIRERLAQDLDAIEAVGGVCIGDGQAEHTRLRTREQIEQFTGDLIGDPPVG